LKESAVEIFGSSNWKGTIQMSGFISNHSLRKNFANDGQYPTFIVNMKVKTFSIITSISMALALTVAILSIIGIAITGFYPGIIVLLLVAMIPIASKVYAKKIINRSNHFQRKYYTALTVVNLLAILIVLWMTFVIVHDRVLNDCC
jgi:hypothetical protein